MCPTVVLDGARLHTLRDMDAVARLQVEVTRAGSRLVVVNAGEDLRRLVALVGLQDVLDVQCVPEAPNPNCPEPNCPEPNCPEPNCPEPNCPEPNCTEPNCTEPNCTEPNCTEPDRTGPSRTGPSRSALSRAGDPAGRTA